MITVSSKQQAGSRIKLGWPLLLTATCLLLTPCSSWAISSNAGTKNGNFLEIETDARGAALGPAMVAMASGAEGMRWNPAALGNTATNEFAATHVQYYQGIMIENASLAYHVEDGALAANIMYLAPGSLDGRDALGNPTGDFQFYDLVGGLGYGRRVRSKEEGTEINLGGAVKMVQEKIANTQQQNPALDLGVLIAPTEALHGGLTIRNLSSGSAGYAKEITGGIAYTFQHVFTGAAALQYTDDAPVRLNVGAEYKISEEDGVIRVGYRTRDTLDDSTDSAITALRNASIAGLTMGAGFTYQPEAIKSMALQFDYAMAPFGALGISHTITVTVKW